MIKKCWLVFWLILLTTGCNLPLTPPAVPPSQTTSSVLPVQVTPAVPTVLSVLPLRKFTLLAPTATRSPNVDDFFSRCPTAGEIASVRKDLSFSFESDPTAPALVCQAAQGSADLTGLQKRAYQSVLVMRLLQFDTPLPWTDKPLYDWFVSTIKGLRFSKSFQYSHCCDPANVIDIKLADNSYLILTDRWVDPSMGGGLMDTMVLYVHEARHNQGLPHTCSNGVDDKTIAELGAWGVQLDLLTWLAQHDRSGFLSAPGDDPNIYRATALFDAGMIRKSRFCKEPTPTPGPDPTLAP